MHTNVTFFSISTAYHDYYFFRGSYSEDEENTGTNDDLFVRKDIPLKLTQAEKEELDKREEGSWKVKDNNFASSKAIEILRERREAKMAKEKKEREEL